MNPMKILVISAAFPPMKVGEAEHALHLCHRLNQRGLEVHVLTTKRETTTDVPFKVHPIMPHWLWQDLPRLTSFIRRCSPDAILLIFTDRDYNYHPMIMFCPFISKFLIPRASFVTQFETQFLSRRVSILTQAALKAAARCAGPKYLDYAYGTLLCASDRIILLSEDHQERFPDIKSKTLVIPPPPIMRVTDDTDEASRQHTREMLGVKPEDFVLAYYGYIYPDKGIETLLKAFRIINDQRSNTRLVMIGASLGSSHDSSYLTGIHQLANDLGIRGSIAWTGEYESDSDKGSLYLRAADSCVLPFDNGVTLNRSSIAAAAAHGLPIITTKGKKLESPFRDRENVLLCPTRDPKSLAAATDQVIANAELRNRLRQGALGLAREFFSWNNAVARTIEALSA